MSEFINWLNNNQGITGFLSLLITIIGFFIVNKNIKIISNQSQKGGANSVNQQAKDGGVNQNTSRDIIN